MKRYKFIPTQKCHFFASSSIEWFVHTNPEMLIKQMKKQGFSFKLYFVPCDILDEYPIESNQPIVSDVVQIGTFSTKEWMG